LHCGVHRNETFALSRVFNSHWIGWGSSTMKHIMPLIFALIPLAAVVSACVACP
jgi:hypothetical protein